MKLEALVFALAFGACAKTASVHVDVTVNLDQQVNEPAAAPKAFGTTPDHVPGRKIPVHAPSLGVADLTEASDDKGEYIVDLGHGKHQGFLSKDKSYIAFNNIPYALPPVGELRLEPPITWLDYTEGVNKGETSVVCPQLNPGRATVNESCLFLDVQVPVSVWERRTVRVIGAATLVSMFGNFTAGSKQQFSPEGLLAAGEGVHDNIIHVSANYRLGALGWMGGHKYLGKWGFANLGLLDQFEVLRWVASYIHVFGGEQSRITALGHGDTAASLMALIARNTRERSPVGKFILLSPSSVTRINDTGLDDVFTKFLNYTGGDSLNAIINDTFSSEAIIKANTKLLQEMYSDGSKLPPFGPTLDYSMIHKPAGQSFGEIEVPGKLHYLLGATDKADPSTDCVLHNITKAAVRDEVSENGLAYRYSFNILPATVGTDLDYLYYPSGGNVSNATFAKEFQQRILDFARYVNPNPEDTEPENALFWHPYSKDTKKIMNFGAPGQKKLDYSLSFVDDTGADSGCGTVDSFHRPQGQYPMSFGGAELK